MAEEYSLVENIDRSALESRNTLFLQRLSLQCPKTAVSLGPGFLESIGLKVKRKTKFEAPKPPAPIKDRRASYNPKFDRTSDWGVERYDNQAQALERRIAQLERQLIDVNCRRPSAQIIIEVARKHGCTVGALVGRSRCKAITAARYEAMTRVREELGYSLPHIGEIFDNRDHTSVLYGIRKHCGELPDRRRA